MEILGDRWSLVIIRDIMFGNLRHFSDLQEHSMEGIASNVLADRLKGLVRLGLLTRSSDPSHKQKVIYSLTEAAIELVPVLAAVGAWGRRHLPVTAALSIRAQLLDEGGPSLWKDFMEKLRVLHLGYEAAEKPSVLMKLNAAYETISRSGR
jgi:DNA-binding HxlR family transcriptional regulator